MLLTPPRRNARLASRSLTKGIGLPKTTYSTLARSNIPPDALRPPVSLLSGLGILSTPAHAYANEFGAMADFATWALVILVYIVLLLAVGLVCGLASRRKSPARPWKRPLAIGSLIALAITVLAVFVTTFLLGKANGPTNEALMLAAGTGATSIPSFLFTWRLLRRSSTTATN